MKVILDVDTGIDDTLNLAYLAALEDVELIGVTCVYGNTDVDQATRNTLGLLDLFGRSDVPVYRGAGHASQNSTYEQQRGSKIFHGDNGIGNVTLDVTRQYEALDAASFLVESARKYGQELVIIASGPLTNLADAIKMDPDVMSRVGKLSLMGGALCVPGNVSAVAEANIMQDPESSKVVFQSDMEIIMVGLDVTSRAIFSRNDLESWKQGSAKAQTVYAIMDHYFKAHELIYPAWNGAAMHDPLAVIALLRPDLVSTSKFKIDVLTDEKQWGRTVMDVNIQNELKKPNVSVALDLDVEGFKNEVITTINKIL
ncbi:nucleoside hydrolase [Erysipelothrix inopinata]|uniref:Nucleoside hydrolase n=1 Tax=Erysipelothrix inopinata TaxID=225084 RepID=A0A7G9RXN5_9FIRM|nr:nucleoside hydrolase [Erysipelothrix inopinata]QNN60360.1 nucleoside hydrolase [Erysipelothrix inopinata]